MDASRRPGPCDGAGGAGGKFPKRRSQKAPATPYARPPTGTRPAILHPASSHEASGDRSGWLSKLVQSPSRFISSVLRWPSAVPLLPPPQASPEVYTELKDQAPELVSVDLLPRVEDQECNGDENSKDNPDNRGISELEQLLKKKTFSRAELEHLTELLNSRTIDVFSENDIERTELLSSRPAPQFEKMASASAGENGVEDYKPSWRISTPGLVSKEHEEKVVSQRDPVRDHLYSIMQGREDGVISPAELAKAYMSSRPSKPSLYSRSVRSQALEEVATLPRVVRFEPKRSDLSSAPSFAFCLSGFSDNPRSQGRNTLYRKTCSPYLRTPLVPRKFSDPSDEGIAGPSTSHWTPLKANLSSGRQVPKRRGSDLDSYPGRCGPIRRIHHKSNLASPSTETKMQYLCSPFTNDLQGSLQKSSLPHVLCDTSVQNVKGSGEAIISCANFASVPSQSSKVARKILQRLDQFVSPPKKNLPELKVVARNESPSNLTFSAFHGEASNSSKNKYLQNFYNSEGNDSLALPNNASATKPLDSFPDNEFDVISKPHAFSGAKGSLELDADNGGSKDSSNLIISGKEKLYDMPDVHGDGSICQKIPHLFSSESQQGLSSKTRRDADHGDLNGQIVFERENTFTFPVASCDAVLSQCPPTPTMPTLLANQSVPRKDQAFAQSASMKGQIFAPIFSFGSKNASSVKFSSTSTCFGGYTDLKFHFGSESKLEVPLSFTSTRTPQVGSPNIVEDKRTENTDLFKHFGGTISSNKLTKTFPGVVKYGTSGVRNDLSNLISFIPSDSAFPATLSVNSTGTKSIERSICSATVTSSASPGCASFGCSTALATGTPGSALGSLFGSQSTLPGIVCLDSQHLVSQMASPPKQVGLVGSSSCNFSGPAIGSTSDANGSVLASSNGAPLFFGSSSGPMFSFTSSATTMTSVKVPSTSPAFGITIQTATARGSSGNDQKNIEKGMANDKIQRAPCLVPAFAQSANAPCFGSPTLHSRRTFQFGSHATSLFPRSQFSMQSSSGLEPQGEKYLNTEYDSNTSRRIIKIKRNKFL